MSFIGIDENDEETVLSERTLGADVADQVLPGVHGVFAIGVKAQSASTPIGFERLFRIA